MGLSLAPVSVRTATRPEDLPHLRRAARIVPRLRHQPDAEPVRLQLVPPAEAQVGELADQRGDGGVPPARGSFGS